MFQNESKENSEDRTDGRRGRQPTNRRNIITDNIFFISKKKINFFTTNDRHKRNVTVPLSFTFHLLWERIYGLNNSSAMDDETQKLLKSWQLLFR